MSDMATRTDDDAALPEGRKPDLPPPVLQVGIIGWARAHLFSSWTNSILTLLALWFLYKTVPPLLDWLIFSANWQEGTSRAMREAGCLLDHGAGTVRADDVRLLSGNGERGESISASS